MLMNAVDSYLALRRAAGFELVVPEYLLRSFARYADQRGDAHVSTQTCIEWASQAPSIGQSDHRLKTVMRMARHLQVEDCRHQVPPGNAFGFRRSRRVPYIFSQAEMSRLIGAATRLGPAGSLRPHTYSTLFALLSVTGLRISEALALRYDDLTSGGVWIRKTKFNKTRLVPLHETAEAGLDRNMAYRRLSDCCDDHVFISMRGNRLGRSGVQWTFRNLLKTIGLDPAPNGRRPRIHDIRHTFAVRALEASPEGRDEVGQHMLALSIYLGHSSISDTYWYLEATHHLMHDIAVSCDNYLRPGAS